MLSKVLFDGAVTMGTNPNCNALVDNSGTSSTIGSVASSTSSEDKSSKAPLNRSCMSLWSLEGVKCNLQKKLKHG